MRFRKKPAGIRFLTGILTLCVVLGAVFAGVCPADGAAGRVGEKSREGVDRAPGQEKTAGEQNALAERAYRAGSLPLFEFAFPRLEEDEQLAWLEKIYADGDIAFFSIAVRGLEAKSSVPDSFAEKVYENDDIAFFSTLADSMDEAGLERWLDRALEDGNWAFQSMLFDKLDKNDEFDERKDGKEKEWAKAQKAEYERVGVTMVDEKTYYYRGQLVGLFLDIRKEGSFYTLNMNPAGTVHVKITRGADGSIIDAASMTEAEAAELLEDMGD